MDFDRYRQLDATALAAGVQAGEFGAAALLSLAQQRLAVVQPRLNAVSQCLAQQALRQLEGPLHGPLAGVPMLIKDAGQDYAGSVTAAGSRALAKLPAAAEHSHMVRRLLEAGAVIFGKTGTPELALKGVSDSQTYGRVNNPWDPSRTPGGSSGGSAAAVAAGVVPMAAANDGGGSIRIPAACCGLVGLKPSRGRISEGPQRGEIWFGANSQGVLSRSVRDTALALDLLSGPEPGDPYALPAQDFRAALTQPLRRLRIAYSSASPIGTPVDDEAVAAVEHTVGLLRRLGHHCEAATPAIDGQQLARSYLHIYFGAVPAAVDAALRDGGGACREADFEPLTRITAALGRATSAGRFAHELQQWNGYARQLALLHARFDLFLTPTLARPPVPHGFGDPPAWQLGLLGALRASGLLGLLTRLGAMDGAIEQIARDNLQAVPFTQLANLTGVPAISLPLHWTTGGLPLGVQFVAAAAQEALLLQLAAELEQAQPWAARLPP